MGALKTPLKRDDKVGEKRENLCAQRTQKTPRVSLPGPLVVETVAVMFTIDSNELVSLVGQPPGRLKSDRRVDVMGSGEDSVLVRQLDLDIVFAGRLDSPCLRSLLGAHKHVISLGHDLVVLGRAMSGKNGEGTIVSLLDVPLLNEIVAFWEKTNWDIARWVGGWNRVESEVQARVSVLDQVGSRLNDLGDDHLKDDQGQGKEEGSGFKHSIRKAREHG
ncbi:MAG: hypothetical protein BYD32DRAFT_405779 [Podila humilis]|nr:MAG: hypothetical protein BYD32DRAFT_405779 [Podila humilis]